MKNANIGNKLIINTVILCCMGILGFIIRNSINTVAGHHALSWWYDINPITGIIGASMICGAKIWYDREFYKLQRKNNYNK